MSDHVHSGRHPIIDVDSIDESTTQSGVRHPEVPVSQADTVHVPKSWVIPIVMLLTGGMIGGGSGSFITTNAAEKMISHQQEMYELKLGSLTAQVKALEERLADQNGQINKLQESIYRIELAVVPRYPTSTPGVRNE